MHRQTCDRWGNSCKSKHLSGTWFFVFSPQKGDDGEPKIMKLAFFSQLKKGLLPWRDFALCLLIGGVIGVITISNGFFAPPVHAAPTLDLSRFDDEMNPAIYVDHLSPVVVKAGETFGLEFALSCAYTDIFPDCLPNATLFVANAPNRKFTPVQLEQDNQTGSRVWKTTLVAPMKKGQSVEYYLEVFEPQGNVNFRYPSSGTIQVNVVETFSEVLVPPSLGITTGEIVLQLPWGNDQSSVGLFEDETMIAGPGAFAISTKGEIALQDPVNRRVLLYNPESDTFQSFPVHLSDAGDLEFQTDGSLLVANFFGEKTDGEESIIPQLYRIKADRGAIEHIGPIFARIPFYIMKDASVLNRDDILVKPMNAQGKGRTQEEQKNDRGIPPLGIRWMDDNRSLFSDPKAGVAIETSSVSPSGFISHFVKTNDGYVIVFRSDVMHVLWLDREGKLMSDTTVKPELYTEWNPYTLVKVTPHGEVWYMSSTQDGGIAIYKITQP